MKNKIKILLEKVLKEATETETAPTIAPPKTKPIEKPTTKPHKTPFKPSRKVDPAPKAKLEEKTVTYSDSNKMNKDLEKRINTNNHHLANLPGYPQTKSGQPFEHEMVSEHFKETIQKIQRLLGLQPNSNLSDQGLMQLAISLVEGIKQIEQGNEEELKQLAIELICQEFNIGKGDINFNIDIESEDVDVSDMEVKKSNEKAPEHLNLEIQKRHMINSLIHGASVKTSGLYHLATEKLNVIHPELIEGYTLLSALIDYGYFHFDDDIIDMFAGGTGVGKVQVKLEEETPQVQVQAKSFLVLLHEMAKGVVEVLTSHNTNLSDEDYNIVLDQADKRTFESMALRMGPKFWEKFNEALHDANVFEYRNNIIAYLSNLEPNQFFSTFKSIFSGNLEILKKIGKEIEVDLRDN